MPSQKLTVRSLERDVYDSIREAILGGDLQPGDALVEAQLSAQFGISKTPVREALIRLKRDGLVESAPHYVNRVATPSSEDIVQACEVREWIETRVVASLAREANPQLLARLQASIEAAERALSEMDDHTYVDAVREFSQMLVDASGNRFAIEMFERLCNTLALIANVSRRAPERRKRSIAEHIKIYEAIRAKDPEAAAESTREHLRSIESDSLEALTHHLHRAVGA
jgi:DNA-binding GntR family transcriptional regulator